MVPCTNASGGLTASSKIEMCLEEYCSIESTVYPLQLRCQGSEHHQALFPRAVRECVRVRRIEWHICVSLVVSVCDLLCSCSLLASLSVIVQLARERLPNQQCFHK